MSQVYLGRALLHSFAIDKTQHSIANHLVLSMCVIKLSGRTAFCQAYTECPIAGACSSPQYVTGLSYRLLHLIISFKHGPTGTVPLPVPVAALVRGKQSDSRPVARGCGGVGETMPSTIASRGRQFGPWSRVDDDRTRHAASCIMGPTIQLPAKCPVWA